MAVRITPGDVNCSRGGSGELAYKIYGIPRYIWFGDKPAKRDGHSGRGEPIVVGHTQKCNLEKPLMSNARAAAHKYHFL